MTTRHASLNDLLPMLQRQHETKYDVVAPSTHLSYAAGHLVIREGRLEVDDGGPVLTHTTLKPSWTFESQLAERMDIPARYVQKLRSTPDEERQGELLTSVGLLDFNINHWMARSNRNWFVRGFLELGAEVGVARAFLSDRYQAIDHLDTVTAMLDGITQAGVDPQSLNVTGDLSQDRLAITVVAPEITAECDRFLGRYSNPTHTSGPKVIVAGLRMTNSETGLGAYQLVPQITVQVCKNGMTRTKDAMRRVHLGGQMDQGRITWSPVTRKANLDLIRFQTTDAVAQFLSHDYLEEVADELDKKGNHLLDSPRTVIDEIGKDLGYTEDERSNILDLFMAGADPRSGGVVNAFTAYARDVEDPDRAIDIEAQAFQILDMAVQRGAT